MTLFGIAMLVFGFVLSATLSVRRRSWLPTLLFIYHLVLAVYSWDYTLTNGGDSVGYFLTEIIPEPVPGTPFVQWVAANLRDLFGATYLDLYMFFHLPGYIGIIVMLGLLNKLGEESETVRKLVPLLVFMPGVHFWTTSIGKDSLSLLAITTVISSAYRSSRISLGAVAGLLLLGMVRPHIAIILGSSWGLALFFGANTGWAMRIITMLALAAGGALAAPSVLDYLHLEAMDAEAIEEYVEARQNSNLGGGSSINIAHYPFPLQFFTLMFRPLFIDASGGLGMLTSLENAVYLLLMVWSLPRIPAVIMGPGSSFFMRMNAIFWFVSVSLLGSTISNLGLAIRQKVMVVPSFLLLTLTAIMVAKRNATKTTPAASPQVPQARTAIPLNPRKST